MRALCLALALAFIPTGVANARREATFQYPYSQVWNAAVRMVRVDLLAAVPEKDRDDGYFLFEYPHDGKTHPGSLQLVRTRTDGVQQVQVVIQVPSMPSYVEQMLLDKLSRKLGSEYGAPLKAKPAEAPKGDQPAKDAEAKPKADGEKGGQKPADEKSPS